MLLKKARKLKKAQKHNFTSGIYKKRIPLGILFYYKQIPETVSMPQGFCIYSL